MPSGWLHLTIVPESDSISYQTRQKVQVPTKLFSSWKVHKAELSGNSLESGSVGNTVSAWHLIHYSSELPQLYLEIIIKMGHSMENNRSRNLGKYTETISLAQLFVVRAISAAPRPKPAHPPVSRQAQAHPASSCTSSSPAGLFCGPHSIFTDSR